MRLRHSDGTPFATGSAALLHHPATEVEVVPRLFVNIHIDGIPTEAVIDTGGVYLICDPRIAEAAGMDQSTSLGWEQVVIRGQRHRGTLQRVLLTLPASAGDSLPVDVTAFVPELDPDEEWNLPTFLGWFCCLERLRFAVDPAAEVFYFGAL